MKIHIRMWYDHLESKAPMQAILYRILTTEGDVFLPPSKEWNIDFTRDIISGKKLVSLLYQTA